ncbi:MAG: Ig-like domain-containing protein [Burkholderiaceae bacterium]
MTPVNDAPVAVDDAVSTDEDTPVTVAVLPNDTDVDGDTLAVTCHPGRQRDGRDDPSAVYTPNADRGHGHLHLHDQRRTRTRRR